MTEQQSYTYLGLAGETAPDRPVDSGLFRLADGSREWEALRRGLPEKPAVRALAVHPGDPAIIYAGTQFGPYRSADRGEHWEDMEIGRFSPLTYGRDIRTSPHDPKVLYAALSPAARSTDGSVYRSDDVGKSWKRFDHGVKADATMMGVTVHPRDPNQVYAISRVGQMFGTTDGGKSWTESKLPEGVRDCYAIAAG